MSHQRLSSLEDDESLRCLASVGGTTVLQRSVGDAPPSGIETIFLWKQPGVAALQYDEGMRLYRRTLSETRNSHLQMVIMEARRIKLMNSARRRLLVSAEAFV